MVVRLYYLKCVNDATRTFDRSIAERFTETDKLKTIRLQKAQRFLLPFRETVRQSFRRIANEETRGKPRVLVCGNRA